VALAYEFEFVGGVKKPTAHTNEKFLMFFVIGGKEIPMYQMLKDSLVCRLKETDAAFNQPYGTVIVPDADENKYATSNNIIKIFVGQQGFSVPKRYYSFYLRLREDAAPMVTIQPFSGARTGMYFKGKANFLSNKQAAAILDDDAESKVFVVRQGLLPLNTLKQMVTINRTVMREGVRAVRIGGKRK